MSIDDNETDMVNFSSGSGYIVGQVMFNYVANTGEDFMFRIYFNNIQVQGNIQGKHDYDAKFESDIKIIIPPFTAVRLTGQNLTNNTGRDMIASLTGRVYGAEWRSRLALDTMQ